MCFFINIILQGQKGIRFIKTVIEANETLFPEANEHSEGTINDLKIDRDLSCF